MTQGQIKNSSTKPPARSSTSGATQKGLGIKKSKKMKLIKAAKINKKFTGGLTAQTERMLGARAGHLEMIGKGRDKGGASAGGQGKKSGAKVTGK